jgi:hypothetical protein
MCIWLCCLWFGTTGLSFAFTPRPSFQARLCDTHVLPACGSLPPWLEFTSRCIQTPKTASFYEAPSVSIPLPRTNGTLSQFTTHTILSAFDSTSAFWISCVSFSILGPRLWSISRGLHPSVSMFKLNALGLRNHPARMWVLSTVPTIASPTYFACGCEMRDQR